MFDVNPSLLRHWETQFSVIRPKRNKKGNRLYTPQDVENLKLIYHLVKEQGMTLEGAKKALKRSGTEAGPNRDMELLERLQRVRAMLEEVREELKASDDEIVVGETSATVRRAGSEGVRPRRGRAVVRIGDDGTEGTPDTASAVGAEDSGEGLKPRRGRRKKEEAETKELFAFYEQSLF